MSEAITPWVHILAVSAWLGPQLFLFIAAVPAIRIIDDSDLRLRVTRIIVTRFGWLAWGAMAVLVLSGISNLFQEGSDAEFDLWSSDYRFFHIFTAKMLLVGVTVLLTALHTFVIGPRQLRLHEELGSDSAEVGRLRRFSAITSGLALLISVAVVYAGALLANDEYSHHLT
jgi:uncharacterized membrane protein